MNNIRRCRLRCSECGAVFEPQEEMYLWTDGKTSEYVCCDCFDGLFDDLTRHERASLIGSEIRLAGETPPS